jgi:drug/metabolite transporter (DMT)-like permease
MHPGVIQALLAALLFGASTPLARLLVGEMPPVLLAGLLYLGSGVGLGLVRLFRRRRQPQVALARADWPWLLGAILFGGVLGPVALMVGLTQLGGATASLLLNLEAVLTALIAWGIFRENADRRVALGMMAIVLGGVLLAWPNGAGGPAVAPTGGVLAVALACLCWAIDNNLTRKASAADALFIASTKGLVAGSVNTLLALTLGAALPAMGLFGLTLLLGLLGYGLSLVLFVLALRSLGTARTGAYFSTAPFAGAALALALPGETVVGPLFWIAAALMALGVWLHLSEHHEHEHTHEVLEHAHAHVHDEHHQHAHEAAGDGREPHLHLHRHEVLTHKHPHYPDLHHRHGHGH